MIHDLSQTLQKILDDSNQEEPLKSAQIVFDRPSEQFNPAQTTVNLFLYDIRENEELRSNEPTVKRQNGQALIHRPPLRVACSYLVTAWPVGGTEVALQEHQLLGQVLQVLSSHSQVPASFLQGSLVGQEPPLPMITAQTDGRGNPAEFWTALGNKLRPSITVTATIAVEVSLPKAFPMVLTDRVRLGERTSPVEEKIAASTLGELSRIGISGTVADADNKPIVGAAVTLLERNLKATSDADGHYALGMLSPGAYTLRVRSGNAVKQESITVPRTDGHHYDVQLP